MRTPTGSSPAPSTSWSRAGRGGEARVAWLGPDEVFGEMGIIDPGPRSASAVAREATACEMRTAEEVDALMTRDPARAMGILRALVQRLRAADRKLAARDGPGGPRPPSPPRALDAL